MKRLYHSSVRKYFAQMRTFIIPRQLKAYGDEFDPGIGSRGAGLESFKALQAAKKVENKRTVCVEDFAEMFLPRAVLKVIQELGVRVPSPVQQVAIRQIMERHDTVLAAPSGSGKTLAFLAPLYAHLLKDRDVYNVPTREMRPRVIIACPTRELAMQTASVCRRFDETTGFHTICFFSSKRWHRRWRMTMKREMPDILIAHPHLILREIESRRLFLDDLRYVIMDEADLLVSPQHEMMGVKLISAVQKRKHYRHLWPVATQFILATSRITRMLHSFVRNRLHSAVNVTSPGLHLPPPQLVHRFHLVKQRSKLDYTRWILSRVGNVAKTSTPHPVEEAPAPSPKKGPQAESSLTVEAHSGTSLLAHSTERGGNLPAILRPIRWEHLSTVAAPFHFHIPRTHYVPGKRVIIFFASTRSVDGVSQRLKNEGYDVAVVHARLPPEVRKKELQKWASGECNILCSTDLMSVGVDVPVDVVINFDTPTNASVYLSRAGRTGRMGRPGTVISLFLKKERTIAAALRAFTKKRIPLEGVSNNALAMQRPRYAEWRMNRIDKIARQYVSLITHKTIPAHLEKTYLKHNATWRPLFHPKTVGIHAGVPPAQQHKVMDRVARDALWYRREQLAIRKGGRAKFGATKGVWLRMEGAKPLFAGRSESTGWSSMPSRPPS